MDTKHHQLADKTPPALHLRVLHTSDLHGALRGYDYLADRPSRALGLTRTATLIRSARAAAANTLLFDTGDFLQGSPLCDLAARDEGVSRPHPMIAAMNYLGYDAATLGNHDFNHGAGFLFRCLGDATFPFVSCNFLHRVGPSAGRPVLPPYTLLTRDVTDDAGATHSLRIAAIGCLPPQTIDWDHHLAADYATTDMVRASADAVAAARAEGADLVVLLAHTGIDPDAPADRAENALVALAALDGVDLVLGGHTHRVFPTPGDRGAEGGVIDPANGFIHGTPVLMPGFNGNHLGQADLVLAPRPGGGWQVAGTKCSALPLIRRDAEGHITADTREDPALVVATEASHAATLDHIREPVGEALTPFHSYFSLLANDASVQIVARAQAHYLRRAVAGLPLADLPLLSAAAPFKTGCLGGPDHFTDIPAGPLTRRSITDLYLYPNTFCAVKLNGAQLAEWLENSASIFTHLPAGGPPDQPLKRADFPGYRFDVICGLTYRIDLSQPPRYDAHGALSNPGAYRIRDLRHKDMPVRADQTFLLATNAYRVFGIGFSGPGPAPEVVFETRTANRDLLLAYVRETGPLSLQAQPNWRFEPLGGVTALYDTAPAARAHLADPALPRLHDLGDTPEGFARFRVTL